MGTFTYTSDPANNLIDQVRFLTGNTIKDESLVDDEEIAYALEKYSNNVNAACCLVCEAAAARWAKKQEVRVSNYSVKQDSIYDRLTKLAEKFRVKGVNASMFMMPAMSKTEKQNNVDDEDKVQPSFKRGMFENPMAPTPSDTESLT